MKRLPEQFDKENADEAYIAELLQDVRPFEPSAERMQRVWMALEQSPSQRPRVRMRGPVIAGLLLCAATAASATMPHVWHRLQRPSTDAAPAPTAIIAKTAHHRVPPAPPPAPVFGPEPTAEEVALPSVAAPAPSVAIRRSTSAKSHAVVAQPADSPTSSMLMIEAIKERRAGNLARARDLAAEYRSKNPTGALYEESLALSLQAAAVLGDDDAKSLAKLYLQRYPGGRFRAQAQRVFDNAH